MSARNKVLSILCIGMTSVAATAGGDPLTWHSQVGEALTAAEATNRLLLVDLYADWCFWCKRLEEEVFSTAEFQQYAGKFVLLRVDVEDGGEGTRLQERFAVTSLPTTLIVDHRLVKFGEVRGYSRSAGFIRKIEYEIAAFRQLEVDFERQREDSDVETLAALAEEFRHRADGDRAGVLYRRLLATGGLPAEREAWARFRLADVLRLGRDLTTAREELDLASRQALAVEDHELQERITLLKAQIALDGGDCDRAESELREFLARHPSSQFQAFAHRTLEHLETDNSLCV
jgi:thioredoxin-related protein